MQIQAGITIYDATIGKKIFMFSNELTSFFSKSVKNNIGIKKRKRRKEKQENWVHFGKVMCHCDQMMFSGN